MRRFDTQRAQRRAETKRSRETKMGSDGQPVAPPAPKMGREPGDLIRSPTGRWYLVVDGGSWRTLPADIAFMAAEWDDAHKAAKAAGRTEPLPAPEALKVALALFATGQRT